MAVRGKLGLESALPSAVHSALGLAHLKHQGSGDRDRSGVGGAELASVRCHVVRRGELEERC